MMQKLFTKGLWIAAVSMGITMFGACSDDVKGASGSDGNGDSDSTPAVDEDNDGYGPPQDCDDNNPAVHPGATEDQNNGIDDDCDGRTDEAFDSDDICGEAEVDFTSQTPTVLLLIDQSGSMNEGFPSNNDPWRWDVVKEALINPVDGIVLQLESDVRFGLSLYTSEGGGSVPDECPMLTDVAPALDNYDAIFDPYDAAGLGVDTPTTESVEAASVTLQQITAPGPKVIVLATDGDPDTCEDPDAHNAQTQALAEAAVRAAYEDHGIYTFVISVGDDTTPEHMQRMANAGQGVAEDGDDVQWWLANDSQGLVDAFDTIINGVRSCVMDLSGEIVEGKEGSCAVSYVSDGVPTQLTYNDENGWRANSLTQIELVGDACEAIKSGAASASVACPCDAYTVPE
ncbi:MAG: VWA domain-containing protein [Deltaproteobacteria bacterium]|nr:VWA domain-containing protein [Deltaproteobacteria bacterium]MBN2672362.1 VWA domain-containing protein [Deltaproteobacteria bacterium]